MPIDSQPYVPFSQRTGIVPTPPQLKLNEASEELRRLIDYYINLEIDRESRSTGHGSYFLEKWKRVSQDLHVLFFKKDIGSYSSGPYDVKRSLNAITKTGNIGQLFDLVEFLVRHPSCSTTLKRELTNAFDMARAAYRIYDHAYISAIGTDEQAQAFKNAIKDAEVRNATAARKQLIAAGIALRNGDWAGSICESIHAVEAVAVSLASSENTLGAALNVIERRGRLHGSLKEAFKKLYGYSSDAEGIRHSLVFENEAQADEADALFMLGACASFVSYLLARST